MEWHADNDSVSDYIQRLTLATEHSDHAAQLLLGLVLAQQGRPADALPLLRPPLQALQLVREIRVQAPGLEPLIFPVTVPLPGSLLAYDGLIGE